MYLLNIYGDASPIQFKCKMASKWDTLNVLNYFNIYSVISTSEDESSKTKNI